MIKNDIQKLEVGSVVVLFEIDCTEFGGDILRFHGHTIAHNAGDLELASNPLYAGSLSWNAGDNTLLIGKGGMVEQTNDIRAVSIIWKGLEYVAWPSQIEGMDIDGSGSPISPTLTVGNLNGIVSSLCIYFNDLLQAKVTVRKTLVKYLDSANFTSTNPTADPSEELVETWYIEAKTSEDNESVSFQLSSPIDVGGQRIPSRDITGMCHWALTGGYRGPDCGYMGMAMFTEDDEPTDDPSDDVCGGRITSCKLRFGEYEQLPFGGMPGANLLRY